MTRYFFFLLVFTFIAQTSFSKENEYFNVCGKLYVERKFQKILQSLEFNKNEKKLICGSDEPGWQDIPDNQAIYLMNNYLAQRGFYDVEVKRIERKIFFDLKERKRVRRVIFHNAPNSFYHLKYVGADDAILNSDTLDEVEAWAKSRLEFLGYPCPEIVVRASKDSGDVHVWLEPRERVRVLTVNRTGLEGVSPRAATRFDAFKLNQFYNGHWMELTSKRVVDSGLADYASFVHDCKDKSQLGVFKQELTRGPDRSVRLSIGASTQEYPIAKVKWDIYKLDKMASQNRAEIKLSNREQTIKDEFRWFVFEDAPRLSLVPRVEVSRYSEDFYSVLAQNYEFAINWTADDSHHNYQLEMTPRYHVEDTVEGAGSDHVSFMSFQTRAALMSHMYEYYQLSPRSGYQLTGSWWLRRKGVGSSQNGDRITVAGSMLYNWGRYDPPQFVLGARFRFDQLTSESLYDTPPSMRIYLGGDNDLRGFNRKVINNGGLGFDRAIYLGIEGRFTSLLPYKIQPILFVDAANTLVREGDFEKLVFWSPGFGVRWESPFGSVRSTLGYGMVEGQVREQNPMVSEQWTFYISLGKEF